MNSAARPARSLEHRGAGFMAPKGKRPFRSGSTCVVVADLDLKFFCSQPDRQAFRRGFHLFRLPQGALTYRRHAPPVFEELCTNGAVLRTFASNFARQNSGRDDGLEL